MTERIYYLPQASSAPHRPQTNWTPWILLLAGFLIFQLSHGGWPFEPIRDHDRQQAEPEDQQIDDKANPDSDPKPEPASKPNAQDTFVVRVFETQASDAPGWLVKQIQNDQFWLKWLTAEQKIRLHTFDPDNAQAETVLASAKAQGISPPFWCHIRRDNKQVLSITPFSTNVDSEDWKKIIQSMVK